MAITIEQTPRDYTPSDNPIVWKFRSDEYLQPNFSFVVKVYVNGILDSAHEVYPERNNFSGGYGKFDAMSIALRECESFVPDLVNMIQDNKNYKPIKIEVFERYGTPPATITPGTMSDEITAWKACMDDYEYAKFYSDGLPWTFLTHLPVDLPMEIRLADPFFLAWIGDNTDCLVYIMLWRSDGTDITDTFVPIPALVNVLVNLSPTQLVDEGFFTDANFEECDYYTYQLVTTVGSFPLSELRRVNLNKQECYYGRGLWWLNKLGGYDQYCFYHNYNVSTNITQQSYGQQLGGWDTSFGPVLYVFDAGLAGTYDYVKDMDDGFEVTTDYMDVKTFNWLCFSLLESVLVFAIYEGDRVGNRHILPRNTSWAPGQDRFEELFNLTVTGELPNGRKSQTI